MTAHETHESQQLADRIVFRIDFRGPFLISTGHARAGLDTTIDHSDPLPRTALKGALRAEAKHRLGLPDSVVERIFGSPARQADWHWSAVNWGDEGVITTPAARIKLTSDGLADSGFLAMEELAWARPAHTTAEFVGDGSAPAADRLVLRAAARSLTGLGSARRRGRGWVRLVDLESDGAPTEWTEADTQAVITLRGSL